ncbi:uncharacterized protein METZ01_LOCUS180540, partial [marine metagenome]
VPDSYAAFTKADAASACTRDTASSVFPAMLKSD